MPTQGATADDRRQVGESVDDRLGVMVAQLWKYHYLLPPSTMSPRKMRWDMVVIVLVMINCFVIPVELCFRTFQDLVESTDGGSIFKGVDLAIDFLFALDIAINFRTTYFDRDGELVVDYKLIASSYMWRPPYWFWMDLLGTIPWDVFNQLLLGSGDAGVRHRYSHR